jgi:hypothetical protein
LAQIYKETHCITTSFFNHSSVLSSSRFRAGSNTSETGGTVHPAAQIIENPLYDYYTIDFDIAVVRVSDSALLRLSSSRNYL